MKGEIMLYTHVKTGNLYEVLDSEAKLERTCDPVVVYRSVETGKTWVRPQSEFFDGRFLPTMTIEDIFNEMKPHQEELKRLKQEVVDFQANCKHYWHEDSNVFWSGKYCKICGTNT